MPPIEPENAIHDDIRSSPSKNVRRSTSWTNGRPWTFEEVEELREMASTQTIPTLARHFGRSEKSVRAKLRSLRFEQHDLAGFKVKDLAAFLGVPVRRVRRWREKEYLRGVNGRITAESFEEFCKLYPEKIPYGKLDESVRLWLRGYGYQATESQ